MRRGSLLFGALLLLFPGCGSEETKPPPPGPEGTTAAFDFAADWRGGAGF